MGGHALTHNTFHTRKTDADLVLNKFADGTNTTVGEVVLIVESVARLSVDEVQEVGRCGKNFRRRKHRLVEFGTLKLDVEQFLDLVEFWSKLAVELVTTNA